MNSEITYKDSALKNIEGKNYDLLGKFSELQKD